MRRVTPSPLGVAFACAVSLWLAASEASAQKAAPGKGAGSAETAPAARAAALKASGDEALDRKRFREALAAYDASLALVADPALLFNRGRALEFLARYPEALASIEEFDGKATPELRARVPGLATLLADLRARVATIAIKCASAGARVLLDKRELGTCPLAPSLRVNAGRQVLEVIAEGAFPYRRDLDLKGAAVTEIDVQLTSRDASGLLVVKSSMAGVRVRVDERDLGLAPAETGLLPGTHQVTVGKDSYETASTQVVLGRGERKELVLDPIARPGLLTRWWFWTAIGVVAAGATTSVILLTTERSPGSGDFSPGRVTQ